MLAFALRASCLNSRRMGDRVEKGAWRSWTRPTTASTLRPDRPSSTSPGWKPSGRAPCTCRKLISDDQYDTAQTILATNPCEAGTGQEQPLLPAHGAVWRGHCVHLRHALRDSGPQQPIVNLQDTSTLEIHFNPTALPAAAGERQSGRLPSCLS